MRCLPNEGPMHSRNSGKNYRKWLQNLGLNLVGFFCMPMPTQPLGWFKKKIETSEDMVGLKYRTVGLATDLMQAMGVKVTQLPGGEIVTRLTRFLEATVELMQVLARACGRTHLSDLTLDDLTTFDREMHHLTGIAYGGVTPR